MAATFPIRTPEQAFSLVGTLGKFRIPGQFQGTALVEGQSPGDVKLVFASGKVVPIVSYPFYYEQPVLGASGDGGGFPWLLTALVVGAGVFYVKKVRPAVDEERYARQSKKWDTPEYKAMLRRSVERGPR